MVPRGGRWPPLLQCGSCRDALRRRARSAYVPPMSRPVTVTLDHDKSLEDLRRRIDENIDEFTSGLAGQIAVKVERAWDGDVLRFEARALFQKLSGTVELFPQHVRITVVLPDMLAGMAEKVAAKIEKRGAIMLEDKRSGA